MKTAIVNIGTIVTGDWRDPFAQGDCISRSTRARFFPWVPRRADLADCDVVIDADGTTAIPGFIGQVPTPFGDWTPRQKTVGFLESYRTAARRRRSARPKYTCPGGRRIPKG